MSILLAREFKRMGHEVEFILCVACGELLEEVATEFPTVDLGASRLRDAPWKLRRHLSDTHPDVLLAAMWPLTALAGLAIRLAGVQTRLIISEHSDFRKRTSIKKWERKVLRIGGRWLYSNASRIIAVSAGVADSLAECAGLDRDSIRVIYNPIRLPGDQSIPASDKELVEWWIEAEMCLISVGSLKPAKDFSTLFRAVGMLSKTTDARLLVIGNGPLRMELEQLIKNLNLQDHIRMPGYRPDPYPYLNLADVFMLSSAWEGLGNVIIEALAVGTPVVATDCQSGPREVLDNGRFGILIPVGDSEALAVGAMQTMRELRDSEALMARAREFSPEMAARAYLEAEG